MRITSTAFADGQPIPPRFTCEGEDVSPPLEWTDVPTGTEELALICDDPDAPRGTWVHWVIYGLPPNAHGLPSHVPASRILPDGTHQGTNDFDRLGYGGPCPPPGKVHHYHFKLYALDVPLRLEPGATKGELLETMEGHVIIDAQLTGTYHRDR